MEINVHSHSINNNEIFSDETGYLGNLLSETANLWLCASQAELKGHVTMFRSCYINEKSTQKRNRYPLAIFIFTQTLENTPSQVHLLELLDFLAI